MIVQPHHPHLTVLPSTVLGRWSVVLAAVSLVALWVFYAMVDAGQVGGETLLDNWLLTGPLLVVAIAGLGGLIAAIAAVIRGGERGLVVLIPVIWGLLVALFALGELANPH